MKNNYAASCPIAFYSPGGNHYHSDVKLWFIAKISSNDGHLWLETHWNGSQGDINRLSVFTSRLDAEIQCLTLNATPPGDWKVYPFDDLDLHVMMKTMASRGKAVLGLSMIFGFSSSASAALSSRSQGFSTVSTPCDIPLDSTTLPDPPPIIEFGRATFQFIADCWASTIADLVASAARINALNPAEISAMAGAALRCVDLKPAPTRTGLALYVSTFSLDRQAWVVSPALNRNQIH